jgi:Chlorite dismutase
LQAVKPSVVSRLCWGFMLNLFAFAGGDSGTWEVMSIRSVRGAGLEPVRRLAVRPVADAKVVTPTHWVLIGAMSNLRYTTRGELTELRSRQEPLGRTGAMLAALIPIRKSEAWWELAQDERRAIFEEQSQHTAIGLDYLPSIARQLYHSRDFGEPFDFLTWFEFSSEHASAFDILLNRLRATPEWAFVEREVDIRLRLA